MFQVSSAEGTGEKAKQQLAVCSNDESSISSNRGNYVELLHTLAAKDEKLARHLESRDIYVFWLLKHDSERFNCSNRWCG